MNKKARIKTSTKAILWLIIIYLALGVIYHLSYPTGSWTTDLMTGGFNQLKLWFKF
jgi:hypothetical protein